MFKIARNDGESAALRFLYGTAFGRAILKPLTSRFVSRACGLFMSSAASRFLIKGFVKKNGIELDDYVSDSFKSFNDFFTRKIKDERRPVDFAPDALISPCDGLLSAYRAKKDSIIPVKGSTYTLKSLLESEELSEKYENCLCLVYRLCVDNYHRYCYVDGGEKEDNVFISGKLHTVRPIALEREPVFVRNCREYTVIHTDNFGDTLQMEVGAMLVGRIKNHHEKKRVRRGEEKGMFLYGGSTVIVLLENGRAEADAEYFQNTEKGRETPVRMGQRIGRKS